MPSVFVQFCVSLLLFSLTKGCFLPTRHEFLPGRCCGVSIAVKSPGWSGWRSYNYFSVYWSVKGEYGCRGKFKPHLQSSQENVSYSHHSVVFLLFLSSPCNVGVREACQASSSVGWLLQHMAVMWTLSACPFLIGELAELIWAPMSFLCFQFLDLDFYCKHHPSAEKT